MAQASAFKAIACLVKNGLLNLVKEEKLISAREQPRLEGIEYYEMFKLTEEGEKILTDKRRHPRHSLHLPIEYYWADLETGNPGFTLNVSEEGLSVDLFKRVKVGENLKLRILNAAYGFIEIFAKVMWINHPPRKRETYRSGLKIVNLSPENKKRLGNLLANVGT